MKTYNYYYDGRAVSKSIFLSVVHEDWEDDVKDGEYSWGYYRATER
jgi:hypothetical protein